MKYPGLTDREITQAQLLGSFMTFTRTFYELRTGREFELSSPISRECRHITLCKALKRVMNGECKRLMINIPPRYGKTEWAIHFVAWALANYPDSNHLYVSFAQSVAETQTHIIRDIVSMPYFKAMFGVSIDPLLSSRHHWRTNHLGVTFAAGEEGAITSKGAGLQGVLDSEGKPRYGGCIIIDDIHKPADVYSDTVRQRTNDWYYSTLSSRLNDPINTPIIFIGQILHEDDLPSNLKKMKNPDGTLEWEIVSLPALDIHNNVLDERKHTKEMLFEMKRKQPYVFAAQMQQSALPPGGGIFKKDDFLILDNEPKIISTFITADTAETDKDYNDATVFSFWGVYRIEHRGIDTGLYGLHWIDCRELRCEPKDLENEFYDFYATSMRYKVKPTTAAIEKKSTGVTLCSVLQGTPGLRILDVERTKAGGSKTTRFLECQPYVSAKRITFTKGARHAEMCIEHCRKITANDTHRHDDIADTMQTAIQCALIEGTLLPIDTSQSDEVMQALTTRMNQLSHLRQRI